MYFSDNTMTTLEAQNKQLVN